MRAKSIISAMLFVLISVVIKNSALAQTDQKDAKKWLRSKEWRQGITMKPHSSVNADEFYKQYYANQPVWDKVFTFLKTQDLEKLAPGKYPIDGDNAYATITLAPSKQFDQTNWESHKKYIDLHYVISGEEKIGVAPVSTATVIKTYDDTKDVANYTVDGTFYVASPGRFFLFFPEDAHRPSIKVNDVIQVKKLVIKIKMAN